MKAFHIDRNSLSKKDHHQTSVQMLDDLNQKIKEQKYKTLTNLWTWEVCIARKANFTTWNI